MLEPAGFSSQTGAAKWVVNPFPEAMTPPRTHKLPSRSASPPSVSSFLSLRGQACSFPKRHLPSRSGVLASKAGGKSALSSHHQGNCALGNISPVMVGWQRRCEGKLTHLQVDGSPVVA